MKPAMPLQPADVLFIGVGKMGLPMALHLQAAGQAVVVSDTSDERLALAQAQGLPVVRHEAAAEVLRHARLVFSSLPDDAALCAVGAQVAEGAAPGCVYVDTSTVSLAASAEVAALCEARGVRHLRVTVSGNNKMAEAAQLTVMASGPRDAYDAVAGLLQAFGPHVFYLGGAEEARLMKLVVNLMIAQTSAMLAEALTLGQKGGLDWQDMWRVLGTSAVGSPIVRAKAVQLSAGDYTPTFTVEQMLKDLGLILDAGQASHVPLPQTALTQQLMHAAMAQGFGQDDYAAVIKVAQAAAGLPLPRRAEAPR